MDWSDRVSATFRKYKGLLPSSILGGAFAGLGTSLAIVATAPVLIPALAVGVPTFGISWYLWGRQENKYKREFDDFKDRSRTIYEIEEARKVKQYIDKKKGKTIDVPEGVQSIDDKQFHWVMESEHFEKEYKGQAYQEIFKPIDLRRTETEEDLEERIHKRIYNKFDSIKSGLGIDLVENTLGNDYVNNIIKNVNVTRWMSSTSFNPNSSYDRDIVYDKLSTDNKKKIIEKHYSKDYDELTNNSGFISMEEILTYNRNSAFDKSYKNKLEDWVFNITWDNKNSINFVKSLKWA